VPGYSEPGSGSDLASVRTKRVRDGTHTSHGHKTLDHAGATCRLDLLPVRTDPAAKRSAGISFLLIDMKPRSHRASINTIGRLA